MKEINIYEIIKKHSNICFDDYEGVEDAIKDACQQVLELAAEMAEVEYSNQKEWSEFHQNYIHHIYGIDKQSILDVINQVK